MELGPKTSQESQIRTKTAKKKKKDFGAKIAKTNYTQRSKIVILRGTGTKTLQEISNKDQNCKKQLYSGTKNSHFTWSRDQKDYKNLKYEPKLQKPIILKD